MTTEESALLLEANRLNYRLRSAFFYRKLKEYKTLSFPLVIVDLFPVEHLYSWDERGSWGIGPDAFSYVDAHPDLHLIQVFCHPKLLREYPTLLAYYRNIASLSQKAVRYLTGIDVKGFENKENQKLLNETQVLTLARLFNTHVSLIIDTSIQSLTKEELHGLLLISTGAQIDGSWRNRIGDEAESIVKRLLVNGAKERHMLAALIPGTGTRADIYDPSRLEEQSGLLESYRGILLNNQTSFLFSSEPDISLLNKDGATIGVIEVKGGTDPAGALERYGASKKSFEESRRNNGQVKTILIASCITAEVQERIQQDSTISRYFNLTEVLSNAERLSELLRYIFDILDA
ncbi:MAG TPA: XcyI family restriction endonuclease [Ktedonobacteraceae bacterium]|nr:XcyI family restriction endonuclease [Ktedonobacteraceae bacterium]